MALGDVIRKLRTEKGLSPGQLAKLSGVSRPYLWQLESGGKTNPSFEVLEKLAHCLGVTVSDFSEAEPGEVGSSDELPSGLSLFYEQRGACLGVRKRDLDVMKNINFRDRQPEAPEDWELLFLFLKKWAR